MAHNKIVSQVEEALRWAAQLLERPFELEASVQFVVHERLESLTDMFVFQKRILKQKKYICKINRQLKEMKPLIYPIVKQIRILSLKNCLYCLNIS